MNHETDALRYQTANVKAEPWLTLPEIAKHLKVSKETLYRMIYRKEIPFTRIGKVYRFKASAVDQHFGGPRFEHVSYDEFSCLRLLRSRACRRMEG